MSKFKMNCGYCGKKCNMEEDFCVPQDSVYVCKSCYNWQQKVSDLEAKLAEKDEQIKELNNIILISQLQAPEEQRLKIIGSSCCQYNPKRDKISFCIEQLEKVKGKIQHNILFVNCDDYVNVIEEIDNQIEQLKKEVE